MVGGGASGATGASAAITSGTRSRTMLSISLPRTAAPKPASSVAATTSARQPRQPSTGMPGRRVPTSMRAMSAVAASIASPSIRYPQGTPRPAKSPPARTYIAPQSGETMNPQKSGGMLMALPPRPSG